MSWLDKILPPKIKREDNGKSAIPEGLWSKCAACGTTLYTTELANNHHVCPKCNHHHAINARERLAMLFDEHDSEEMAAHIKPIDILKFKDSKKYPDRLSAARKSTGEEDALVVAEGKICGVPAVVAVFEFRFIGGSMGSVVGERFVQGVRRAVEKNCAFICVAASGGARMQEGLNSLMQMAKTSAALHLLSERKLPFVSVLTDPTMGGVSASFAFLGDAVLAEPNALIGFAGPRVIEQTVRETLPDGFQRAEFLLKKGAIDQIVDRRELKNRLAQLLCLLQNLPQPQASNACCKDDAPSEPPLTEADM